MEVSLSFEELEARLILHNLPKIGSKRFLQLVNYFGSAKEALAFQSAWLKASLPSSCQSIDINLIKENIYKSLEWLEQDNQHALFWDSPQYPVLLREISDYPPVLFVKGNPNILENPQLAIVGSRHASKPGLDTTFQFAKSLASGGFTITSGLSLGTLVVEATLSSGSLITAKLAAEQGREVFAIPGSIHYPAVKGCHQLIREGAALVETVDHILEALQGWKNIDIVEPEKVVKKETMVVDSLLLTSLRAAPQTSEALAVSLSLSFEDVLIELTDLELIGKVVCEAGIWYAC